MRREGGTISLHKNKRNRAKTDGKGATGSKWC